MSKNINNIDRIQRYKFTKQSSSRSRSNSNSKSNNVSPLETKIYHTPLSKKHIAIGPNSKNNNKTFKSRDPRFGDNSESGLEYECGWKLRKAYSFLDDMIVRDIDIIEKELKKTKSDISESKKKVAQYAYNKNMEYQIKSKGVKIDTLQNALISLRNRKNRIGEKDLAQQT
eukprot:UN08609